MTERCDSSSVALPYLNTPWYDAHVSHVGGDHAVAVEKPPSIFVRHELRDDRGAQSAREPGFSRGHRAHEPRQETAKLGVRQVAARATPDSLEQERGGWAPTPEKDHAGLGAQTPQRQQRRKGTTGGTRCVQEQHAGPVPAQQAAGDRGRGAPARDALGPQDRSASPPQSDVSDDER